MIKKIINYSILFSLTNIINANNIEFTKALNNYDFNKVKKMIDNKEVDLKKPNNKCITPLDIALNKFDNSNLMNIDKIVNIIEYMEKNGAIRYISAEDKKRCYIILKEKKREKKIKNIKKLSDNEIIESQLKEFRVSTNFSSDSTKSYFLNSFTIIINLFNNSLFGEDGNYIKLINRHNKLYLNTNIDIADWKENKNYVPFHINNNKIEILDKIDTKLLKKELEILFKNKNYLNQITVHVNKLYNSLSNTLNEEQRKEILHSIELNKKSFQYLIKDNIRNIKLLKRLLN